MRRAAQPYFSAEDVFAALDEYARDQRVSVEEASAILLVDALLIRKLLPRPRQRDWSTPTFLTPRRNSDH